MFFAQIAAGGLWQTARIFSHAPAKSFMSSARPAKSPHFLNKVRRSNAFGNRQARKLFLKRCCLCAIFCFDTEPFLYPYLRRKARQKAQLLLRDPAPPRCFKKVDRVQIRACGAPSSQAAPRNFRFFIIDGAARGLSFIKCRDGAALLCRLPMRRPLVSVVKKSRQNRQKWRRNEIFSFIFPPIWF